MRKTLHFMFHNGGTATVRIRPSAMEGYVAKGDYAHTDESAGKQRAISHIISPVYGRTQQALEASLREQLEAAYGGIASMRSEDDA